MDNKTEEEIIELRAKARMNELKVQALVNILAREGLVARDEFEKEVSSLCEEGSSD